MIFLILRFESNNYNNNDYFINSFEYEIICVQLKNYF